MSTSHTIYERYLDWATSGLKPGAFDEALRLALALILAVLLNRLMFERRMASPPLHWLLTILAFFGTMQFPLQNLQLDRVARGWIFAVCVCGLVSLPHLASFYLARTESVRKRISLLLYALVLGLFTTDLLRN